MIVDPLTLEHDMDLCADNVNGVADSLKETVDNVSKRIDQLDIDAARQQLHLLTMIGAAQKGIIADKDVKINELRDRIYDLDNELAEARNDLENAKDDIVHLAERNKVLSDTWSTCRDNLDRANGGLQASVRIMLAMAVFMLVELLVIAWLALA